MKRWRRRMVFRNTMLCWHGMAFRGVTKQLGLSGCDTNTGFLVLHHGNVSTNSSRIRISYVPRQWKYQASWVHQGWLVPLFENSIEPFVAKPYVQSCNRSYVTRDLTNSRKEPAQNHRFIESSTISNLLPLNRSHHFPLVLARSELQIPNALPRSSRQLAILDRNRNTCSHQCALDMCLWRISFQLKAKRNVSSSVGLNVLLLKRAINFPNLNNSRAYHPLLQHYTPMN